MFVVCCALWCGCGVYVDVSVLCVVHMGVHKIQANLDIRVYPDTAVQCTVYGISGTAVQTVQLHDHV